MMRRRCTVRVGLVLFVMCIVAAAMAGLLLSQTATRSRAQEVSTEVVFRQGKDGYKGSTDTRIFRAEPDQNYGCPEGQTNAECELQLGQNQGLHSLVRFEVPSCSEVDPGAPCIPEDVFICEAKLRLYAHNCGQQPCRTIEAGAYEVLRTWEESEATWNMATVSDAWQEEGCEGETDRSPTLLSERTIYQIGYYEWDVTPAVRHWVQEPASNQGLIIRQTDRCDALLGCEWDIWHSEYGFLTDDPVRPALVVRYATEPGRIVLVKTSIGGDGTFQFTSQTLAPPSFSLTTIAGSAAREFDSLPPGTYDVSETDPGPDWELTSATCDDGSDPSAIDLGCGETVTCTFANTKLGKIVVVKNALGDNGTFDFTSQTLTPSAFSLTTVGFTASREFASLQPGTYDVAEAGPPPGWTLISATCDDGSNPAAIDLDPGEIVTCTFTDRADVGTIVVVKNTIGGDSTFEFTSQTLTPSPFYLTTVGGTASREFGGLATGTYDVAESDPPPGWTLISATCDDGNQPNAISLDSGETVTCIFTNRGRFQIYLPVVPRQRCIPECVQWSWEEPFNFSSDAAEYLRARDWDWDLGGGMFDITQDGWLKVETTRRPSQDDPDLSQDKWIFPILWRNLPDLGSCFCIGIRFKHTQHAPYGTTIAANSATISGELFQPARRYRGTPEGIENVLSLHQNDELFQARIIDPPWQGVWRGTPDEEPHWAYVTLEINEYSLYVDCRPGEPLCDPAARVTSDLRPGSIHVGSHDDRSAEQGEDKLPWWTEVWVDHIGIWSLALWP
jgi:hypothetical protein